MCSSRRQSSGEASGEEAGARSPAAVGPHSGFTTPAATPSREKWPVGTLVARSRPKPVQPVSFESRQRHSRSRHCCVAELSRVVQLSGSPYHRASGTNGARELGRVGAGSCGRVLCRACVTLTPWDTRRCLGSFLCPRLTLRKVPHSFEAVPGDGRYGAPTVPRDLRNAITRRKNSLIQERARTQHTHGSRTLVRKNHPTESPCSKLESSCQGRGFERVHAGCGF